MESPAEFMERLERIMPVTYYAGIGSRETPADILALMAEIAEGLDVNFKRYWTLRSGGAEGADAAFESKAGNKDIFLPWEGFNGRSAKNYGYSTGSSLGAQLLAEAFHPNWAACSEGARKLHSRNIHQILGSDLNTPVSMVICWTKDGKQGGGTGQALRIAKHMKIPIFDLALNGTVEKLLQFVTELDSF